MALLTVSAGWALREPASALSPVKYEVYFDYGRTDLTQQNEITVTQFAAAASKTWPSDQIFLTAHTDTAEASQALSEARAQTVRNRLIQLGIAEDRILVFAYGDTKPLVETRRNVREPQNRRVDLKFTWMKKGP